MLQSFQKHRWDLKFSHLFVKISNPLLFFLFTCILHYKELRWQIHNLCQHHLKWYSQQFLLILLQYQQCSFKHSFPTILYNGLLWIILQ